MLASLSSTVAGWHDFYMLAGSASATLVGLIFVAVSLHIDLVEESGVSVIFTLARRTFTNFILIVIIALVFLVPRQTSSVLGWPLLALGVLDMSLAVLGGGSVLRELTHTAGWQNVTIRIIRPIALPLATSAGLIVVAATVLAGTSSYLYWMVPVVVLILTSAALDAWDLMLGLAHHKARHAGK